MLLAPLTLVCLGCTEISKLARAKAKCSPGNRLSPLRLLRGFTLIELMVVVIVVSVLAVIAVPSVTRRMRDRRTQAAAQEVATLFRNARLRALGRGSAVLVRYTTTEPLGKLELLEAVRGTSTPVAECQNMPTSSCTLSTWTAADSRSLRTFTPANMGNAQDIHLEMYAPPGTGSAVDHVDVCFTPVGRAYVRYDAGDAFQTMTGVPVARLWRHDSNGETEGLQRVVLIPPNGAARLGTSEQRQ